MIKKILIISLISLIMVTFSITVVAQTEMDLETAPPPPAPSIENIRAGGSGALGLMKLNLDDLNELLTDNNFAELNNTIITYGGGGIVGDKPGHRFGGFGAGGSINSSNNDKNVFLDVGYGGFLYERGMYVENEIDIAVGGISGGGGMELTLMDGEPDPFDEIIKNVEDSNSVTMQKGFLALKPRANIHYQFLDNWGMSLAAGYLLTYDIGEGFTIGEDTISDGKLSNFSAPVINLQVSFGF